MSIGQMMNNTEVSKGGFQVGAVNHLKMHNKHGTMQNIKQSTKRTLA
jgi:hypothetical protein